MYLFQQIFTTITKSSPTKQKQHRFLPYAAEAIENPQKSVFFSLFIWAGNPPGGTELVGQYVSLSEVSAYRLEYT